MPIKATQINFLNDKVMKQEFKKVCAVMAIPKFKGQPGHKTNSRRRVTTTWRVLFDSGSDGDLLFLKAGTARKSNILYTRRHSPQSWETSNGIFLTEKVARDLELTFPMFSHSKRIRIDPDIIEYNDEQSSPMFDLIIGTETMHKLGVKLDFSELQLTVDQITLPMLHIKDLQSKQARQQMYTDSEPLSTQDDLKRVTRILDSTYEKANLEEVVKDNCAHLSDDQRHKLLELLETYEELFDGTLGDFQTEPVSFELKEGAKPWHGRAYPVPHIHLQTLKKEVERLCKIGVLEWQPASEWASPTFIIAKKQGTVRVLFDAREINKRLVRKPFPIPKIVHVLQELQGFTYATQIDLNMGYYTIRLDPDASKICTLILPWGKYSYKRLPMGIACSPDIFQAKMSELMAHLEYVRTYIDDLLVISNGNFDDHLHKLEEVLKRLQKAKLRVNAPKSTFGQQEVEYLGYILTRDGIKPHPNKVQAILAINPPTNVKELRSFLGCVQYYRDMWEKRSDMLAILTDLVAECGQTKATRKAGTKKKPFHWSDDHQKAFDDVKTTIAKEVTLAYPDYDKPFEIYTDASSKQLGSVIVQDNRPLAFFSRKLSDAQTRYTVTDQELLAIIETLKEFKGMLWGQRIKIYTDHKNLIRDALGSTSDRVYRWRIMLEEFGPEIVHIKGIHNTVADAISRLDYDPKINPDRISYHMCHVDASRTRTVRNKDTNQSAEITEQHGINPEQFKWKAFTNRLVSYSGDTQDNEMYTNSPRYSHMTFGHLFANRSLSEDDEIYPLTVSEIAEEQHLDSTLQKYFNLEGERYKVKIVEETEVLCENGKLVIPKTLQLRCIAWYHHWLQHPGHTRLEETIRETMTWNGMRDQIRKHVKQCHQCQINKKKQQKYGKLPTKIVETIPWETLCVDLIGPYTLKAKDGTEMDFMCLTMIDPATSWFEMVELPVVEKPIRNKKRKRNGAYKVDNKEYFDKSSRQISRLVYKSWFSRYPRCRKIIYDNGSEFKLYFEDLCESYRIKRKPTTIKNPQANAILERVHQVVVSMLRTSGLDMADTITEESVSDFLDDASWAIRSSYHTVLKATPGAAIFGRDMLFDIPFIADWNKIGEYRQKQTDANTKRENKRRIDYDYCVGGQVLLKKDGILRKAETRYHPEPWNISQVHTNGTIRIHSGSKSERLNIRRVKPYHAAA